MWKVILILVIIIVILLILYWRTQAKLKELKFQKRSQSSRYGKIAEQFFPFLEDYPYSTANFRFIGTPIDGVQFEDDKIIFVEFKTADSKLTERQKRIKQLIERGKVKFKEFRIE